MIPITTWAELGKMEDLFRRSERQRIAAYVKECREDDTDRPVVQVFDVLAKKIAEGDHWR